MNKQKNVLMLTDWYPTESRPINGIFIKEQIEAISELGYNCILGFRNPEYKECTFRKIDSSNGIPIFEFNYRKSKIPFLSILKLTLAVWKTFFHIKNKYKIDFIHTHTFSVAFPTALLFKIFGVKHIHTEHWSKVLLKNLNKFDTSKYKFILKNSNYILPVSSQLENSVLSYYENPKTVVIKNIINERFQYKEVKNDICNILFVGNLIENKGIKDLLAVSLQLLEEGYEFTLSIIGDGILANFCEEFIDKHNLSENIFWLGQVDYNQIHKYFQDCSFYCQPSYLETFGITFRQAISCGKPVVAYKLDVLEGDFDEKNSLLSPKGDKIQLAENIKKMIKSYSNYNSIEIAERAKSKYSKQKYKEKINKIYKELLT